MLRQITTAYVMAVAKPHFDAGWTIADILHTLDWTPNGHRYPHDAVHGIHNPGAWFAARLRAWTHQDGTPLRSPDQRAAAEAEQRRAQAIAAAHRHAARQAARQAQQQAQQPAEVEAAGVGGVAVRSQGAGQRDPRPFRERWAAQIAAGQAQAVHSSDG